MPTPAADPRADLYVDLATVKQSIGATATDNDALITQAIGAACRQIDRRCGRRFYADTVATARTFPVVGQTHVADREQVLLVDDIASLDGLAVASGTPWAAVAGWEAGPDNALAYGRPITQLRAYSGWLPVSGRVQVTARWGWPAVPDEVVQAALLLASRLYRRKDSPQGVMGVGEWGPTRVSRTDPDVEALLAPFVVHAIA